MSTIITRISVEEQRQRALHVGAVNFLQKPVTREALAQAFGQIQTFIEARVKDLLVVEDDETERRSIIELIGNGDVQVTAVATGKEALEALRQRKFECLVLDLSLPDMSGFEVLSEMEKDPNIARVPTVVYTGRELTEGEEMALRKTASSIIMKDARSPERLLAETALFLHRVESRLPENKRRMVRQVFARDPTLEGKKMLIVDDDFRNIFTLTSYLEKHRLDIVHAENGRQALERLRERPDTDVVLMDIMMPEMDGYETTRAIRQMERFKNLPIIAVTAKAMKGDREKCIAAGCSDYIPKPVDVEQLLSLMRVWLYR